MRRIVLAAMMIACWATGALALSDSAIPTKIPTIWGSSAPGGNITCPIPIPSQISVTAGRASWTDGFPPLTFLPSVSGGIPPFGQDFNGVFCQLSQWSRWFQAGGALAYDSSFSSSVGGYPAGATLRVLATPGCFWVSNIDNNSSNPDTGGANWINTCTYLIGQPNVWTAVQNFSAGEQLPGSYAYKCVAGDNTSALNTIIGSGIHDLVISGTCQVTTLSTLPANFTLRARNHVSDCLSTTSATGNVVTMNSAGGDRIDNLCFTASVNRTSGSYIVMTGTNITVSNVTMWQFFNGIEMLNVGSPATACPSPNGGNPCSGARVRDVRMYGSPSSAPNDCIVVDGSNVSPGQPSNTDIAISGFFCSGGNTTFYVKNGIEIQEAGDVHIDHFEAEFVGAVPSNDNAAILVDPSGGQIVQWVEVSDSLLDAGGAHGIEAFARNGASINAVYVVNNWVASNASGAGILLKTDSGFGSNIIDASVTNNHVINNADGIEYGDSSNIQRMIVSGNFAVGNSGIGINFGVSSAGFMLVNNWCQLNGIGLGFPSATLANTSAIGNILVSNTTQVFGSPTLTINSLNSPTIP